jgi:hypothetical protein
MIHSGELAVHISQRLGRAPSYANALLLPVILEVQNLQLS